MSRRHRIVAITPELLCSLLADMSTGIALPNGIRVNAIKDGVPETATGLRAGISDRGDINLMIADESFSEVPEGDLIPFMCISMQSREPESV